MKLPDIEGRAALPGDGAWDEARRSWNLAIDQRPAAVVEAASAADVQALLSAGLRVAPQSTGHGSEQLGPLDGVVLVKTTALREIEVRGDIVRLGAGVRAGEAADAAARHGLTPVLGLAEGVGVTGLALGGGTGWLSRAYGLACAGVVAFDVVTAGGEALRVEDGDLFWALRGGGGRGAVVTAVELRAHRVEVSAGLLTYPADRAAEVLHRFHAWSAGAPEALGAVFRYVNIPGNPLVVVGAAFTGDGADVLEPMREGAASDGFAPVDPAQLVRVAGDPVDPMPTLGTSLLLRELDVEAVAGVLAGMGPIGALEVRLLGGALARAQDGALPSLDGAYSLFAGGPASEALAGALDELRARMGPWASPQELLTGAPRGTDLARVFPDTWERLGRVRDAYDPDRRIVVAHD